MKLNKKSFKQIALTLSFGLLLSPAAVSAQSGFWGVNAGCTSINSESVLTSLVATLAAEEVSAEEEAGLLQIREEEKLARDVYQTLYQSSANEVFNNIAASEQHHMDSIKVLLDKYTIVDPVGANDVGIFTDPTIQDLYDTLIAAAALSPVEALKVGAAIEELEISDLTDLLAQADNIDILTVYQNLLKASRNHLRAFVSQIPADDPYVPQYLTAEELQAILEAPLETGLYDQYGESLYGHGSWLNFSDTDGDGVCDSIEEVEMFTAANLEEAYLNGKQTEELRQLKKLRKLKKINRKYKKTIAKLNRKIRKLRK